MKQIAKFYIKGNYKLQEIICNETFKTNMNKIVFKYKLTNIMIQTDRYNNNVVIFLTPDIFNLLNSSRVEDIEHDILYYCDFFEKYESNTIENDIYNQPFTISKNKKLKLIKTSKNYYKNDEIKLQKLIEMENNLL